MKQEDGCPAENPDIELVRRCCAGDEQAYTRLLDRYKNRIFSYLYRLVRSRIDAEDLAQETFIRAFRALATYDPSFPFSGWLFRISHNLAVDFFRRRKTPPFVPAEEPTAPGPAEIFRRERQKEAIEQAISRLPVEYRAVLLLYHREGKTYDEIARILDLPLGTVKTRLHRARERLRDELLTVKHLLPQIRNKQ